MSGDIFRMRREFPAQAGIPAAELSLTDLQSEFIDWMLDPQKEGNQKEWAEAHGIRPQRISEWKRSNFFQRAWRDRADKLNGGPERVQLVINAMYQNAINGDVQAQKAYMQYVAQTSPPKPKQRDDADVASMTDEEFEERLRSFLKKGA